MMSRQSMRPRGAYSVIWSVALVVEIRNRN